MPETSRLAEQARRLSATPTLRWFRVAPPQLLMALVMTALVSMIVLGISEFAAGRLNDIRAEAIRLRDTVSSITAIREANGHAESAQRGFLLTQDKRYLQPFNAASANAQRAMVELIAITRDNADWARRAQALVKLATQKLDEMRLTVSNEEQGRHEQALILLRAGFGVQIMEELVSQANAFEAQQTALLRERQDEIAQALTRQRWGVGLVVFLNLVFLAVLANSMIRQFTLRETHRAELERQAEQLELQVASRTEELSSLSSYLQTTIEREKGRLARDLHDELGGILTSAKIDVSWLEGHAKGIDADVTPRLARLSAAIDEAVHVKRRVVEDLRPSLLDHLGLGAALSWYVNETCEKAGLRCHLTTLADGDVVAPELAIAIYRLVQEGLTNIMKHAQASEVEVMLGEEESDGQLGYRLTLSDNGLGIVNFKPEALSHGIAGMRQRARSLGGTFELHTAPGKGTTIDAFFPIPA